MQNVPLGPHLVLRDHRPLGIAEQAGMDERKVAEVGEVLHLPRRVAGPRIWPAGDCLPTGGLELGDVRQRPARFLERDPDDPVALLTAERRGARLGRHARGVGELRDRSARAGRPVPPAVVRAHDLVPLHRSERERGTPVDAQVGEGVRRPARVAPEDEGLVQQVGRDRPVAQLRGVRNRMPTRAQGRVVATGGRRMRRLGHAGRTSTEASLR